MGENNNLEERFFASKEQPTRKKISEMTKCEHRTCDIICIFFFFKRLHATIEYISRYLVSSVVVLSPEPHI